MKVNRNTPYTERATNRFPWAELNAGDSFLIKNGNDVDRVSALRAGKKYYETRNVKAVLRTKKEANGIRVYRVS